MSDKIMVLCSGGMKSAFLTGLAKREGDPILIHIDHGQKNRLYEQQAVAALAEYYQVEVQTLTTRPTFAIQSPLRAIVRSFCLVLDMARYYGCKQIYHGFDKDTWQAIPELHEMHLTTNFLTNLRKLFLGIQPDYRITDTNQFQFTGTVDIDLPLYLLRLPHVLRLGNSYTIPWHLTRTCESEHQQACGTCLACKRRITAFKCLQQEDPETYTL